jgi:hypothetical protein
MVLKVGELTELLVDYFGRRWAPLILNGIKIGSRRWGRRRRESCGGRRRGWGRFCC